MTRVPLCPIARRTQRSKRDGPRRGKEREKKRSYHCQPPPVLPPSQIDDRFRRTLVRVSGNDVSRGVSNHLSNFLFKFKRRGERCLSFRVGPVDVKRQKRFFLRGRTLSLFLFLVVEESCCWGTRRGEGGGRVQGSGGSDLLRVVVIRYTTKVVGSDSLDTHTRKPQTQRG